MPEGDSFSSDAIESIIAKYREYLGETLSFRKNSTDKTREETIQTYIDGIKYAINEKNGNDSVFETEAEQNFLSLLPVLIVRKDRDNIIKLIGLIRRSACIYNWGTNHKSYKTYIVTFVDYIDMIVHRTKELNDLRKELNSNHVKEDENVSTILESSFKRREIFFHDELEKNFTFRLGSQSRTSGDKIWLPLLFLKKIFQVQGKNDYDKWIQSLFKSIYVHYEYRDNQGEEKVGKISFENDKFFLELANNNNGGKDVWVIIPKDERQEYRYRVLTPTGKGNGKEPMTVDSLDKIAIDHVKPIDHTLRDLEDAEKLKMLDNVSEAYKELTKSKKKKTIKSEDLETAANEFVNSLKAKETDIIQLKRELNRIKRDGPLRLMKSEYNSQKSNNVSFQKIINVGNNGEDVYYGIIETGIKKYKCKKEFVLYQMLNDNLADNGKLYIVEESKIPITNNPVDLNKIDLNYI